MDVYKIIASELNLTPIQVKNSITLLDEGATIPFISRYRKEKTGNLNEIQIEEIKSLNDKYILLQKRKEAIITSISGQEKLTAELKSRIDNCFSITELEDIYLPYKPKRVTRAEVARKNGLAPLATAILLQNDSRLNDTAHKFINKDVESAEDALKGARDIIAEQVSENEKARNIVRRSFVREGVITAKVVKGKEEEAYKYRDYFDFSENLSRCSSHRLLAIRRGEKEGFLKVSISCDEDNAMMPIERLYIKSNNQCAQHIKEAIKDSYKRLLKPGIETEFASSSKQDADITAIRIFAKNLQQLLLAPPLGQKIILGIDPGFRTGCKVVCISSEGDFIENRTIYPHPPQENVNEAASIIKELCIKYSVQAIVIGNGTAGKETEHFIKSLGLNNSIEVYSVSEDGASVYSASKTAREEFPDFDVTVRGAISIARRVQDPLAELVKIDPKSIGVGQYQHDVDQTLLKKSLDQTVENCVNAVGVNLNTASKHILTYVSGLGETLAQNIVNYRSENGSFKSRKEIMKVARMGAKTFEQCAGFLRISDSKNPLDNSGIHPESYYIVEKMAADLNCSVKELMEKKELISKIDINRYIDQQTGVPTLQDIIAELEKPGRDPRMQRRMSSIENNIKTIDEVRAGMILTGIITNITDFGCFVDLGIKEKGLVHISQITDRFIKDPHAVVSINQEVKVKVMSVDSERKRIQLTMKDIN